MKRFYFLMTIALCSISSHAQIDTSFSIVRKNIPARFSFTKYNKGVIVQNYPVYTIDKSQIHRLNMLIRSFVNNESGYDSLLQNYIQLDSIFQTKELQFTEIIKTHELRAKNYSDSYQSLLMINTKLDQQLKNCKDIALAEHKKRKSNAAFLGILAGLSVGVIIGVVIDH